jgi:archaellum component FlaC
MSTLFDLRQIRDRLKNIKDNLPHNQAPVEREINEAVKRVEAAIEEVIKSLNPRP